MDYNKLSKVSDSLLSDDSRSEQRLNDLLAGPHADDFRYYRNQLNKCSEDKRKERVVTWYNILKDAKPEIAEQLKSEFSEYFTTEKQEPTKESEKQEPTKEEKPQVSEKELEREKGECYQAVCKALDSNNKLKAIASRHSTWNSLGGRIGSYSHEWQNPENYKPIQNIESKLGQYSNKIAYSSWSGEYYEGIWIEGGSKYRPFESHDLYGQYDDSTNITVYSPMRVSQSLQKQILQDLYDKRDEKGFSHLSMEDIQEVYNKIVR